MTLNTVVLLDGPIGGQMAFDLALAAILEAAGPARPEALVRRTVSPDGVVEISTLIGQGLPAIVDCHFRPDGPLAVEDEYLDGVLQRHRCVVEVSWDTAYGYVGGAERLHLAAVRVLNARLPTGVDLRWIDESTDEVHSESRP